MRRRLRCLSSLACSPFDRKKRRLRSSLSMPDRCIEVWKRFRRASGSSPSLKFTNAKYILPNAEILDISRARPPNSAVPDTTGDTSPTALIEYHIAKIQYNDQAMRRQLQKSVAPPNRHSREGGNPGTGGFLTAADPLLKSSPMRLTHAFLGEHGRSLLLPLLLRPLPIHLRLILPNLAHQNLGHLHLHSPHNHM